MDQLDGFLELAGTRAGSADIHFLAGDGVRRQRGLFLGPARQRDAAGVRHDIQCGADGGVCTRALHHQLGHAAVRVLRHLRDEVFLAGVDDVFDAQFLRHLKALVDEVDQDGLGAVGDGAHRGQQADGARADDGNVLAGFQATAVDAVQRDGQGLCHRGDVPGHVVGQFPQHVGRMRERLAHAALDVNAQNMQARAAVRAADGARIALAAVEVRVDDDMVAHFQAAGIVLGNGQDLAGDLMADDARVRDERVRSAERADVAAADARGAHFDEGLTLLGNGFGNVDALDLPRFRKFDSSHN